MLEVFNPLPPHVIITSVAIILTIVLSLESRETLYLLIMSFLVLLIATNEGQAEKLLPLLVLMPSIFFLAPKFSRELGFLILGLLLAVPAVRELLTPQKALALSSLSLAISVLLSHGPSGRVTGALWTTLGVVLTLITSLFTPVAPLLPLSYLLTFPRNKRSYAYVILTMGGLAILFRAGPITLPRPELEVPSWLITGTVLQMAVIGYSFVEGWRSLIRKKQTTFLIILATLTLPFIRGNEPEFVLIFSAAAVRALVSFVIPHEET
ncbi:hypothetical protein [Pyrococcus yayanosii]|uniref:Uncharacterized protein n=1 Tax=Pyrococcus yayanosii (strain CH1 / JCM 16557) TaxID=529709 RepID=F8AF71_PYRYC|nr:hypothetical protein [Pyrococcus yayanosii]AEH24899.1 hypothetical protein PYCH_12210 [Pyrococcus yayanosii CH1]